MVGCTRRCMAREADRQTHGQTIPSVQDKGLQDLHSGGPFCRAVHLCCALGDKKIDKKKQKLEGKQRKKTEKQKKKEKEIGKIKNKVK